MSIITGVSTSEEFVDAINDKGASLTNESTPEGLLEAINATGGNVTFQSTNEAIVTAVNTEVGPTTFDIVFETLYSPYYDGWGLGVANEGIELPEKYWDVGSYDAKLKDDDSLVIILDKDGLNVRLTEIYYQFRPGSRVFSFQSTPEVLQVFAKYGADLKNCPVHIEAPQGVLQIEDTPSKAVNIDELFGVEHLPNWIVEEKYDYYIILDSCHASSIQEALENYPADDYEVIHASILAHGDSGSVYSVKLECPTLSVSGGITESGPNREYLLLTELDEYEYYVQFNSCTDTVIVEKLTPNPVVNDEPVEEPTPEPTTTPVSDGSLTDGSLSDGSLNN